MKKVRQIQALVWTGIIILVLVACADSEDGELSRMQERYEPTEVALMDYDSFRRRMTDGEWEGFARYLPVLQEDAAFELVDGESQTGLNGDGKVAQEGERVVFYRYSLGKTTTISRFAESYAGNDGAEEMRIQEVRVFDLDGDGIQELILEWTPLGDFLILHCENEHFYGYMFVYRGFEMLQTNGVYLASGGAVDNCWMRLRIEDGSWVEEVLAEEEWDSYYLKGELVDEETFRQQIEAYVTEDVTGYVPQRCAEG